MNYLTFLFLLIRNIEENFQKISTDDNNRKIASSDAENRRLDSKSARTGLQTIEDIRGDNPYLNPDGSINTDIVEPKVEDFGERYKALAEHSRQQVFTAFRAVPNLFGLPTSTGFNTEEYESAYRLYNRTMVRPVQRLIADAYERITGVPGALTIIPFSIEETATEKTVQ